MANFYLFVLNLNQREKIEIVSSANKIKINSRSLHLALFCD